MSEQNRWPNDPRTNGNQATLQEKLEYIVFLEREHRLLGVSVLPKDPSEKLQTDDVVDYVIDVIHQSIEVLEDKEAIHQPMLD